VTLGTVVRVIPGSRGRSARRLRGAVLALVAGTCVAVPAITQPSPAAAATPATPGSAGSPAWDRAWGWDGTASAVPAGCAATAGGGITCAGRPLTYARVVLRARLPRVPGAVTRIALDRAGVALPEAGGGTHTYTLTWSKAAVTLSVDGREVSRGASYRGPHRLRISVTSAHPARAGAGLLVEALRVEVPHTTGAAAAPAAAVAGAEVPPATGTPMALPGPVGSELPNRLPDAVAGLQTTTLGASWLLGGTCVAVGVLLGVLRAALASRRRPLAGS
jgi:hypothetical protein